MRTGKTFIMKKCIITTNSVSNVCNGTAKLESSCNIQELDGSPNIYVISSHNLKFED